MRPGHHKRLPNHVIGLVLIVVLTVGSLLAYTKELPWSQGYTVKAVFTTAQNVRIKSPVRIAGVNVGEVTGVEHLTSEDVAYQAATGDDPGAPADDGTPGQQASLVTMELTDDARPLREDTTFKLRPRLFLEGNLFVDVHPGSPSAPEVADGYVFPINQTSTSVQLDQILTTLQSPVRRDLQVFLKEFGDALIRYGGAEGFRELYQTSPGAYKNTSLVNEAILGTEPHDLSGLVENLDETVEALGRNETALQDLVTNLRVVTGSFAAEDESLERAIADLPDVLRVGEPALEHLNDSFPSLRAFAREALPGTRTTPETLEAATPFLEQVRGLVSEDELRGLVADLRPAVPELARLSERTVPFLEESRALSSCFNEVIIPWSNETVPDPEFPATGRVFEETGYSLTGLTGESRSGDGNGQYIRVEAGGGQNTLYPLNNGFIVRSDPESEPDPFYGFVSTEILGSRPALESSAKTPFRPDAPCEEQEPPDLDSGDVGPAPPQEPASTGGSLPAPVEQLGLQARDYITGMAEAGALRAEGERAESNALIRTTARAWARFSDGTWPQLAEQLRAGGDGS